MKSLRSWAVLFASIALALWSYQLVSSALSEPRWNGIPFTKWLDGRDINSTANGREAAIKAIGTNGVSTLMRLLCTPRFMHYDWAYKRSLALRGFRVLGRDAGTAIPELVTLTKDRDEDLRFRAIQCLVEGIGIDESLGKEILQPLQNDPNRDVRDRVALYLHHPEIYFASKGEKEKPHEKQ